MPPEAAIPRNLMSGIRGKCARIPDLRVSGRYHGDGGGRTGYGRARPPAPPGMSRLTGGGVHVPFGTSLAGEYRRISRLKGWPAATGSQFASLSLPGDPAWMNRSSEPSALEIGLAYWKSSQRRARSS